MGFDRYNFFLNSECVLITGRLQAQGRETMKLIKFEEEL